MDVRGDHGWRGRERGKSFYLSNEASPGYYERVAGNTEALGAVVNEDG